MENTPQGWIEIACVTVLAGVAVVLGNLGGCAVPPAVAHDPAECACPEIPSCPPDGFLLAPVAKAPTDAQHSIEKVLKVIEEVQEATREPIEEPAGESLQESPQEPTP
jgi:hypothetical protein